jgi:hypothetical protein
MTVQIEYVVRVGRDEFRPPTDLTDEQIPTVVSDDVYGRLIFRRNDDEAFFEDDLIPLVAGACFQSMEYLAAHKPWRSWVTRYSGDLGLITDGNTITATFNEEPLFAAPATEMIAALLDVGRRAIDDLSPILAHYPAGSDHHNSLVALRAEAEAAVRASPYPLPHDMQ